MAGLRCLLPVDARAARARRLAAAAAGRLTRYLGGAGWKKSDDSRRQRKKIAPSPTTQRTTANVTPSRVLGRANWKYTSIVLIPNRTLATMRAQLRPDWLSLAIKIHRPTPSRP